MNAHMPGTLLCLSPNITNGLIQYTDEGLLLTSKEPLGKPVIAVIEFVQTNDYTQKDVKKALAEQFFSKQERRHFEWGANAYTFEEQFLTNGRLIVSVQLYAVNTQSLPANAA